MHNVLGVDKFTPHMDASGPSDALTEILVAALLLFGLHAIPGGACIPSSKTLNISVSKELSSQSSPSLTGSTEGHLYSQKDPSDIVFPVNYDLFPIRIWHPEIIHMPRTSSLSFAAFHCHKSPCPQL